LKQILKDNELSVYGKKEVLIDRILDNLDIKFEEELELKESLLKDLPTDLYFKILETLDIEEVFNLCNTNKLFDQWICKNDNFWRKRIKDDFKISYTAKYPKDEYQKIYIEGEGVIELIKEVRNIRKNKTLKNKKVLIDIEGIDSFIKEKYEGWKSFFINYDEIKNNKKVNTWIKCFLKR